MTKSLDAPTDRPAVSVIVPVFNGERYLAEALGSVMAQDYGPLELLVVDDGSTDRSIAVAGACPEAIVLAKTHSGLAATLNHGVRHATGELLAFLDADDRWLPGKLSRQVGVLLGEPKPNMVFCLARQFRSETEPQGVREVYSAPQPAIAKVAMLIRSADFHRVGWFAEDRSVHDFMDWYIRAGAAGLRAETIPEVLVERRIHDSNVGRLDPGAQRRRYLTTLRAAVAQRRQLAEGSPTEGSQQ